MRLKAIARIEQVPFKFCIIDHLKAIDDCKKIKPSLQEVELKDLLAPQKEVDFERHKKDHQLKLKNPELSQDIFEEYADYPVVVKVEDHYIILDGHHRLTKAYKAGSKFVTCYVFDRFHWSLDKASDPIRVRIFDVSSYIDHILEMYENCSEDQTKLFHRLVNIDYNKDTWEDLKDYLTSKTESRILLICKRLDDQFELDEDGLVNK